MRPPRFLQCLRPWFAVCRKPSGGVLVGETETPLVRKALELVSADLQARGWHVEIRRGEGPARVLASKGTTRRIVYVACAQYPDPPPASAGEPLTIEDGEAWLARVQVTRHLTPILAPEYLPLPPLRMTGAFEIAAPWPPSLVGLTF